MPSLSSPERSDKFAERLKEQREAAERLARQRMEQARTKVLSSQQKPAPPPAPAPAAQPTPAADGEKPKFTFAREEIVQAQREGEPAQPAPQRPAPPSGYGYQPPAQPYGRVPPPVYQPGGYQPAGFQPGGYQARPYPQGEGAPAPYRSPAPVRNWEGQAPADDEAGAAPVEDEYADEHGTPPAARGQVAQRPRARAYAEDDLDDVFDEEEHPSRRGRRARAEDYSAAYRTYEEDFDEEDEPRSRGGPLVLLLALIAVALIAGGLIYWHFSQNRQVATQGSNVPVITAPKQPAKTVPPAGNEQQATETPSQQPARHKKIYDRILGDETLEPERIVPTEETPKAPVPGQNQSGNVPDNSSQQPQQSIDQLPLPLPPPPEPSGQQGRLDVPQTTGKSEPRQMMAQNETVIAKPAAETTTSDLAVSKSDLRAANGVQDLKVPEVPTAEIGAEANGGGGETGRYHRPDLHPAAGRQQRPAAVATDHRNRPAAGTQAAKAHACRQAEAASAAPGCRRTAAAAASGAAAGPARIGADCAHSLQRPRRLVGATTAAEPGGATV